MARGESPYANGLYSSPRQRSSPLRRDSPARSPAQHELHKIFTDLNLQEQQHAKVYYHQKHVFQEALDAKQRIKAETDELRLRESKASRDSVREEAEAALKAHLEEERRRQQEEQRRRAEAEAEAKRKAEAERKAREEEQRRVREQSERDEAAKRAEAERLRKEQEQRRKAAEDEKRREAERQQREADKAQKDAEAEASRKQQEEQQRKAQAAAAPPAPAAQTAPSTTAASSQAIPANIETRHQEYLALHKRLKKFRIDFWEQSKSNKEFKSKVGDMRREIKKAVGQLRIDGPIENRGAREQMGKVKQVINLSLQDTFSPQVPVNDYLPPHAQLSASSDGTPAPTVPSLTIYTLSILSKAVVTLSITSCVDNAKSAEAPGVLVAQVFSNAALQFPTNPNDPHPASLISILLTKLHASAPQLFGISTPSPPTTSAARTRLCWRREPDASGQKSFIPESAHYDRLVGLGALYAAISLRNFSKTRACNPVPPTAFWESLAMIVNTPAQELQVGQLILLKFMLENSAERVVQFWGATGVALLKEAVVGTQRRVREGGAEAVKTHQSAKALGILEEGWAKGMLFRLG